MSAAAPAPAHARAEQARWIRDGIAAGNTFHFRNQPARRHNAVNLALTAALLAVAVGVVWVSPLLPAALYLPLAALVLGFVYFSLLILVVHEASHGMFLVGADRDATRRFNRLAGWAVSIPFAINYARHWEEGHHIHHLRPMEPDDPQTANLLTGAPLVREVLKMLFVPGYVFLWNPSRRYTTHRWLPAANLAFWAVAGAAAYQRAWTAPVAMVLGLQVVGALNQLKGSMEHGGGIASEPNRNLRSRTSLFPGRALLMPWNISLHFEHHLNYAVPWYALPAYQRALRELMPAPLQPEFFNVEVGRQLMGRKGRLPDALRPLVVESAAE